MSLDHEFSPEDYRFPRLYVADEKSPDMITLYPDKGCYVHGERSGGIKAGLVPYESGWNLILDPVEAKIIRAFAVIVPWLKDEAIYVSAGVKVKLIEVEGVQVNFIAREGEKVDEKTVLAYVVTNKGETRTLKANTKGLIVYIAWRPSSNPERYVYLITDPNDIKMLKPKCSN